MKKLTKFIIIKLVICNSFSSYATEVNQAYLFSLDYLYPQNYFYRFESASKELWSDLDLFMVHRESLVYALENNYLKTQFLKLRAAARMLYVHEKESRNYLPDDIEYLLEVVHRITEKCVMLTNTFSDDQHELKEELYLLLRETNIALEQLLARNKEIVIA